MSYTIDSGLAVGGNPLITVNTEFERTAPEVANAYNFLVMQMQSILQQSPSSTDQTSANQLSSAMNNLRNLAINGLQVNDPVKGLVTDYVTTDMAKQIDLLSRSLRAVGITNTQPTVDQVKQWQDLATQGVNDIMSQALRAYENNNSFQAMIELEYVQNGNDLLETQLTQLNTALTATTSVTDLLGQLQDLHNLIAPGTVDTSAVQAFTDPATLITANQQKIFGLMNDSQKTTFGITSATDITDAKYQGSSPNTLPYGNGIKAAFYATTQLDPSNANYVSTDTYAAAGIFFPPDVTTIAGRQAIYDALTPDQRAFWGITNRDGTNGPSIGPAVYSLMDGESGANEVSNVLHDVIANNAQEGSWTFWYSPGTLTLGDQFTTVAGNSVLVHTAYSGSWAGYLSDTTFTGTINDNIRTSLTGLKAYLAANATGKKPNQWSELQLTGGANPSVTDFTNTTNSIFGQPIDPVVDLKGRSPQDVLKSLLSIRTQLAAQLTQLDQLNPPPASGRDPNSIGAQVATVLADINKYVPDTLDINTQGAQMLTGLSAWIIDNQDQHNPPQSDLSGDIQRNLSQAITAATNLNDTQKQDLQRYMQIFDEFYKSASALLTSITQIIQKMAQNSGR